jgi:O-succinylbenzoate synthase
VRLTGVELVRVELAFSKQIGTAAGVHRARPVLYVRVVSDEAEGWGECAALGEPTVVDPPLAVVEPLAVERAVPRLLAASAARAGHLPGSAEIPRLFGTSAPDRMLAAACEMAVADA